MVGTQNNFSIVLNSNGVPGTIGPSANPISTTYIQKTVVANHDRNINQSTPRANHEITIATDGHTTGSLNNKFCSVFFKVNGPVDIQGTTIYSQLSLDVNTVSGCSLKSNTIGHTKGHLTSGMLNNSHKGYVILIQDRISIFI